MNRPEPRPLPKPLRVLCLLVAALLVCSLGVIVANHRPSTAGDDWKDNAATQIRWGLNYIAGRYGSPSAAKTFWLAHNWY